MFKISHEVPICLLEESRDFNDYDYALVHLFADNHKYYNFYKESINKGRRVILDNSAYELGHPFEIEVYKKYILALEPTEYILPDYRDDSKKNYEAIRSWRCPFEGAALLRGGSITKIGVVHGESYQDFIDNYRLISPYVNKIAISFESFFSDFAESLKISLAEARVRIIYKMCADGIIDTHKPHHILGALSPTEYQYYIKFSWIETVDTSNPILHGILGQRYVGLAGLEKKSKEKLESYINCILSKTQLEDIRYNIKWFRDQFKRTRDQLYTINTNGIDKVESEEYDEVKADHYRCFPIETIELMRRIWGNEMTSTWCEMTAFKYRMRLGHKPTASVEKDIKKEKWYLDKAKELGS